MTDQTPNPRTPTPFTVDVRPVEGIDPRDAVWAVVWNPHINQWNPSAEPWPEYGTEVPGIAAFQSHGDVVLAEPMSESYGYPDPGGGTAPNPSMNLLTDVRDAGTTARPVQIVQHEVHTYETGGEIVRARTVVVTSTIAPTQLVDENPRRKRALIKVATSTSVIIIQPGRQGGGYNPQSATPVGNQAGWLQATGDPVLEIKATAQVECYGAGANTNGVLTNPITVTVWEEMNATVDESRAGVGLIR